MESLAAGAGAVNLIQYGEAGASAVQELSIFFAAAVENLRSCPDEASAPVPALIASSRFLDASGFRRVGHVRVPGFIKDGEWPGQWRFLWGFRSGIFVQVPKLNREL